MSDTVKVMISLPKALLEKIDEAAESAGMSRSAFVRDAIRLRLVHRVDHDRRRRALAELRRSFAGADLDVQEFIRAERDRRMS